MKHRWMTLLWELWAAQMLCTAAAMLPGFLQYFPERAWYKKSFDHRGQKRLGQRNKYLREIAASQRFLLLSDGANSCNTACFMVNLSNMWQKSVRAFVCSLVQAGLTVIRLLHPLLHLVFKIGRCIDGGLGTEIFLRRYSEIEPSGQILPLIGDHFANRYPGERFLIFDRHHQMSLLHQPGVPWYLFR